MTENFELLFEGPADDSAPTLRRIKGVFVADLEFPASDVQRFLENAPIAIKSGSSENELQVPFNLLVKAGAKVIIIKKDPAQTACDLLPIAIEAAPLDLEFESALPYSSKGIVASESTAPDPLELSFDLDVSVVENEKPIETQKPNSEPTSKVVTEGLFSDLALLEPESEPLNQNNKPELKSEVKTAAQDLKENDLTFGLSLEPSAEITEDKITSKNENNNTNTDNTQDSGLALELDVVTSAGSTLFGSKEQSNLKTEEAQQISTKDSVVTTNELPKTTNQSTTREEGESAASATTSFTATNNFTSPTLEEVEETPLELTLQELQALQKPASRPLKFSATPVFVILGLLLLFQINQTFFSTEDAKNPFIALLDQLPKINTEPDAAEQAKALAAKAAELAKSSWYSSEQNYSNRSVKATVWVENKIPIHGSIEITTPEPAPLTKEEIVNGVSPRAWLRRVEIKDLGFKSEGDSTIAKGAALAYISIGEKNIRLAGRAILKSSFSADQNTFIIEATASSNLTDTLEKKSFNPASLQFTSDQSTLTQSFEFTERIELAKK